MKSIAGYTVRELVHEGRETLIYRGERNSDKSPVILKMLRADFPNSRRAAMVRQEFEVATALAAQGAGIVRPIELLELENGPALAMEDFGGVPLNEVIASKKVSIQAFLKIAVRVTEILGQIHQIGYIHKDIKPHNIIINTKTGEIKLIDFGISSRLSRETQTRVAPEMMEGTLAYTSPEQTGRMNRAIDYRSDFYSLGVTMFEMATGSLPFKSSDPIELVHAHIAQTPPAADQMNPELPEAAARIIAKMMAKNAEDRYQSAFGIRADLQLCLEAVKKGSELSNFTPGSHDVSERFQLPQRLYGRETEVAALLKLFEDVLGGATRLVTVKGYSGIGKSSLVNEIDKPVAERRGYYITGKFDQFKRDVPYTAISQAFQDLIRQLATESEQQLAAWKKKVLEALGDNGKVISDLIPELTMLIGPQPPVVELAPSEAQNRFNYLFRNFVRCFAQEGRPLVVFIDDLQWADSASLQLVKLLLTDPDTQNLMFIGAYRDNEVTDAHPLTQLLTDIEQTGVAVHAIQVGPLGKSHVNELVADTVHSSAAQTVPLSELVYRKTGGNPFFVNEFLRTIYQEGFLNFDQAAGRWTWNVDSIDKLNITDNVVELLSSKIRKLPAATQTTILAAACVGNTFDLHTLALVSELPESDAAARLEPALGEGLILPTSDEYKYATQKHSREASLKVSYRFMHDRIQQAAYSLLDEREKVANHLSIGRHLLHNVTPEEREERLIDIVNHLNIGAALIDSPAEKAELIQLNLSAGAKAKRSTAYEAAIRYLEKCTLLMSADSWTSNYKLSLEVYQELVESYFLAGRLEDGDKAAGVVLQNAQNLMDKIRVYQAQMKFYNGAGRIKESLDLGLEVLQMIGIKIPRKPGQAAVLIDLVKLKKTIGFKKVGSFIDIPECSNSEMSAAISIAMFCGVPAYIVSPNHLPLMILTATRLSILNGSNAMSVHAYAAYGLILAGVLADFNGAFEFAELAVKISHKFGYRETEARAICIRELFVRPWIHPLRDVIEPALIGAQKARESGDPEFEAIITSHAYYARFLSGESLKAIDEAYAGSLAPIVEHKQQQAIEIVRMFGQLTSNLIGDSDDRTKLNGARFHHDEGLHRIESTNNRTSFFYYHFTNTYLNILFRRPLEASQSAPKMRTFADAAIAAYGEPKSRFLAGLAYADAALASEKGRGRNLRKAKGLLNSLKKIAKFCPANREHEVYLLEAQILRASGDLESVAEKLDAAIDAARRNGFYNDEALANELAAEFFLQQGRDRIARTYLTDARFGYLRWGALAKVKDLDERHERFLSKMRVSGGRSVTDTGGFQDTTTGATTTTNSMDLTTVIKSTQTLSGEIFLDRIVRSLLQIAIENAGAQRGLLLLESNGEMLIEAEGNIDAQAESRVLQSIRMTSDEKEPTTIVRYVQRTGESVVLGDATREGMFTRSPYVLSNSPKSILCLPIKNKGRTVGILYLENNISSYAFTPDRIEILNILSSQAAISLENARLVAEETERQKLQKEMEMAKEVQMSILPRFSEDSAYLLAAHMSPAAQVGGDYYDYYQMNGTRWIAIGDVTGHGLNSGLMMLMAQTGFSTYLNSTDAPDTIGLFSALNKTLHMNMMERTKQELYMTFTALKADNAGNFEHVGKHEDILVWRKATGKVEVVKSDGFWMGLVPDVSPMLNKATFALNSGDFITLYTDGVIECRSAAGEQFDTARLIQVIEANANAGIEVVKSAIVDKCFEWMHEQDDDLTVFIMQKK